MPYSTTRTIVTIVDENKVQEAVVTISNPATMGKTDAGIIVISPIEDILRKRRKVNGKGIFIAYRVDNYD